MATIQNYSRSKLTQLRLGIITSFARNSQAVVEELVKSKSDRERQIAIHGNRFIENQLVRYSPKNITMEMADKIHHALIEAIDNHYKDCYLAVLFKNAQKCSLLSSEIGNANIY